MQVQSLGRTRTNINAARSRADMKTAIMRAFGEMLRIQHGTW
jgi:hypothetical protein